MISEPELLTYPADQAYLCNQGDVARQFGLPRAFRCGEPIWKEGTGYVTVSFFTPAGELHTAVVDHHNLTALDPGETFPCEPTPLWESMGLDAWAAHCRQQPWWNDRPSKTRFQQFLDCEI